MSYFTKAVIIYSDVGVFIQHVTNT